MSKLGETVLEKGGVIMDLMVLNIMKEISVKTDSKIVLVVLDGVGDLPGENGKTPLESATTPNLDRLAINSALGLLDPIYPGITPGSGPGHLGLFGYNPLRYWIGRGVLSALGVGLEMGPNDVAARGNFCTVDKDGKVVDRRAGRIPTEINAKLCEKISSAVKEIDGVRITVTPEEEHRFVLVLSGEGLGSRVSDTDPQKTGVEPLSPQPLDKDSEKTAKVVSKFVSIVREVLKDERPANMVLLRGFDKLPHIPSLREIYKLTPCAIASYPMYKGIARVVGMDVLKLEGHGELLEEKISLYEENFDRYDYIFFHVKKTDSYGEDGNFASKVHQIEEFDKVLPRILAKNPDVLVITGDHSTPCQLKSHSWHPVPVLFFAKYLRYDPCERFTEREALKGSLGRMYSMQMMPLMMAHAGKLKKYGA